MAQLVLGAEETEGGQERAQRYGEEAAEGAAAQAEAGQKVIVIDRQLG